MTKIIDCCMSDLSGLLIRSKKNIEVQDLLDSVNTESVEETWKRDMDRIGADMWKAIDTVSDRVEYGKQEKKQA